MRKRKKKVNRLLLTWRLVILFSLLINYLQLQEVTTKWVKKQPMVQRHFINVIKDGYWYRCCKYFD